MTSEKRSEIQSHGVGYPKILKTILLLFSINFINGAEIKELTLNFVYLIRSNVLYNFQTHATVW